MIIRVSFFIIFLFFVTALNASNYCAKHLRAHLNLEILEERENLSPFGVDYTLSAHLTNASTHLPAEAVRVRVWDPEGNLVANGETNVSGNWEKTINRVHDHVATSYSVPYAARVLDLTTFQSNYFIYNTSVPQPAVLANYFTFELSGASFATQTARVASSSLTSTHYSVPFNGNLEVLLAPSSELTVSLSNPFAGSFRGVKNASVVGIEGSYYSGQSQVIGYDEQGKEKLKLIAYPNWFGAVHVALADVNRDGVADIVTVPGYGGGALVKIFDGVNGNLLSSFMGFENSLRTGVCLAAGNNPSDGSPVILLGADVGGGPAVKRFDPLGRALAAPFFAFASDFRGGVRVALGDVNGDGILDVITTPAVGADSLIRTFDGAFKNPILLSQFFAFPEAGYRLGLNLSVVDKDRDGKDEIVVGAAFGGSPRVAVFSAEGVLYSSFFAFDSNRRTGVKVASSGGKIFAVTGEGEEAEFRIFSPAGAIQGAHSITSGLTDDSVFRKGWSVFGFREFTQ